MKFHIYTLGWEMNSPSRSGNYFVIRNLTLLILLPLFINPAVSSAQGRSLVLNDIFDVRTFDNSAISPNGRQVVYEQIRPYDNFEDYSFRTYARIKTGHQIWIYNSDYNETPKLLPGLNQVPHNYIIEFSQTGQFLSIMQYKLGDLSIVAYDMVRERALNFNVTPTYAGARAYEPVWISGHELVFSALPEGERPVGTSARTQTGRILTQAWADAWRGDVVTAREVRTLNEDDSDQQESGRLIRANAETGAMQVMAEGLYADLRVSPDGSQLAALAVSKPRPIDPSILLEDDPRIHRLVVFDLETNQIRQLAPDLEFFPYSITWSPDGERVAAYGWAKDESPRSGRFYVIHTGTGAVVRYDHVGLDLASERERAWLQRPERTVFLGDDLAVFARPIPPGEDQSPRFTYKGVRPSGLPRPDWYAVSQNGIVRNLSEGLNGVSSVPVHAGDGHMTIVASDGVYRLRVGEARLKLTPELNGRFQFMPSGTFITHSSLNRPAFPDQALFRVRNDGATSILMVDLRDNHEGEVVVVETPSDDATPMAGSLASGSILFRAEDLAATQLMVARPNSDSPPRELARINDHLKGIDLGTWRTVTYQVADPGGQHLPQTIQSCVLLPPGYRPEAPPPLVVEVYPGVGPNCLNGGPAITYADSDSPYLWAGRGYAYARLTTAPREMLKTNDGPIASLPQVIEAGVDALISANFADPERVALYGFSQGGLSALYVAAHLDRFKAVIAMNGWANMFSHYFGANGVYSTVYSEDFSFGNFGRYDAEVGGAFGIGQTPFENPDIYIRNSPVFLAPRITAPVMLVHSDMDSFPMSQFDEMYGALLRAGKDARYVRYWGEGHAPSSPANIRDLWRRWDEFLAETGVAPAAAPQPQP